MTTHSKLIYALKDGNIVSIDEVQSGKDCGCVCPACGDELIARKGQKRMHHFAHRSNEDCEYGYESSLHLAAKDILSRSKKMVIPPVYVEFPQSSKSKQLLYLEKKISFDHVELEKRFDDIIPDIVVDSGDKYFFRLSALNSTGLDVVKVRFIGQRQLYNNGTVKVVPLCIRRKQQANPSRRL